MNLVHKLGSLTSTGRVDAPKLTVTPPPPPPQAEPPVIMTNNGAPVGVTISFEVPRAQAEIRYTTDGSTPTPSSLKYTAPFTVSAPAKVAAITVVPNFTPSDPVSTTFTPSIHVATPVFSPAGQLNISGTVVFAIRTSTPGAVIHYTTDGSTPTRSSPVYTSPITLYANATVKAFAVASGFLDSVVAQAVFAFQAVALDNQNQA